MSCETTNDPVELTDTAEDGVLRYSTRLVERTIDRALGTLRVSQAKTNVSFLRLHSDIIHDQVHEADHKLHEWRHSLDKIDSTRVDAN